MNRIQLGILTSLLVLTAQANALTLVPTFTDGGGGGQTWNTVRKGVINQAISDWEAVVTDSQTVNVNFDFTNAGTSGYLGQWSGSILASAGTNLYPWTSGVTQTVHFNADLFTGANYTWWDSTPTTSGDQPFAAWDALTVARHELGHMLGFTANFYVDDFGGSNIDKWSSHITGSTFDLGGLNVAMASSSNLGHLAGNNDLMVVALPNNIRRDISTTDLQMLSLAYGYNVVIPEPASIGLLGFASIVLLRRRAA